MNDWISCPSCGNRNVLIQTSVVPGLVYFVCGVCGSESGVKESYDEENSGASIT